MHHNFLLFLLLVLFSMSSCEKKNNDHHTIPIENTTQLVTNEAEDKLEDERFKISTHTKSKNTYIDTASLHDTFTLSDTKNTRYTVNISNKKVTFKENPKPIMLITFFASWCPPCLYEIPYFNDIQKKYQTHLFLAGILVHDTMDTPTVKSFIAKHTIKYYVSNSIQNNDFASLTTKILHLPRNFPIPLTVMYVNGTYFTHYEGIVPIEMIEYDIEEAIKTLKNQKG